jgi:hypothetical protein
MSKYKLLTILLLAALYAWLYDLANTAARRFSRLRMRKP